MSVTQGAPPQRPDWSVSQFNVIKSELIKLRTVRSTYWTYLIAIAATIGLGLLFSWGSTFAYSQGELPPEVVWDSAGTALSGIFMSQLAGADLSPWQTVFIVFLTMASSAGTAGIPGGGIAMMAFMLDLLGLPPTYLALYLVVDRFFDYPITAINVWGDLVVAAIVDQELKDG